MAVVLAKHSFVTGEISPAMLGRQDVDKYAAAGTTVRNFMVSYVGGIISRAGTAFCGYSKQTGRNYPPRLIGFQFSNNQGLALEFGNQYMRVLSDGAYVTDVSAAISNITQANPAQIVTTTAYGVASASPNSSVVSASYAPGDTVTLAGGTYSTPGILTVATTLLHSANYANPGQGYVPGNTITLAGGTALTSPVVTVGTTQVAAIGGVGSAGSGGIPNGYGIVQGTTGTGTKFTARVYINGFGQIQVSSGANVVTGGSYTVNPSLSGESVTGISGNAVGLLGATLNFLSMGVNTVGVTTAGVLTINPSAGILTQSSTSGSGTGATFVGIFGPAAMTVSQVGSYSVFPSNPVSQASTSGNGVGATFNLSQIGVTPNFSIGDWLYVTGAGGMSQINGRTVVISNIAGFTLTLSDVFGNPVDSTTWSAYTSGGNVERIYTLATPYAEADLNYIKIEQSADTMSICCVNPYTPTEYIPQDLTRTTDISWAFSPIVPTQTVNPPTGLSGSASSSGSVDYAYQVTAVDPVTGTESIASAIVTVSNAVEIATTAGTITLAFSGATPGVNEYFWYKALPGYGTPVPIGAQFGYAGFSYGNTFIDPNITADFSQSPPTHVNPFARGRILGAAPVAVGSGYSQNTVGITFNTSTGSGANITPVVSSTGTIVAYIINDTGSGYAQTDTATITGGSGATVKLNIGPNSGTYPSLPAYFQERRGYANSLNNPDTYWFSQPGAYTNFDVRNPTIASDAITGSPWSVIVNGVQWMLQTSGGLLVMTGLRAWMLVGAGSIATNVQPISPSNQNDVPQAFTGVSPLVKPILINFDVVYVDPNGVYYYDLPYQLYTLSEPLDLTDISAHLFDGYTVGSNCYCEKPYRVIWSVRSDGALLSLTYYKTQKVQGWARHDTQGYFVSTCTVLEPPVNAAYFATQRFFAEGPAYCIERMDNRIWPNVESVWAVDCGLSYPQPQPAANITISSATGLGSLTGVTNLVGGTGYSVNVSVTIADDFQGTGLGATATATVVGGSITAVNFPTNGSGYTHPKLTFVDAAGSAGGSGASARPILNNQATVNAITGAPFSPGNVGSVIRAGGGIATITQYNSPTQVLVNINVPFPQVVPNSGGILPTITAGNWTMTAPVTTITIPHLAGMTVTGLADGNVIPPTVVSSAGVLTLATPASAIVVGLGFQAQFQDVPMDTGNPTTQGQRKNLAATTLRVEDSRGIKVGANQRDGSALSPPQLATVWNNMVPIPETPQTGAVNFAPPPHNALANPLCTGDVRLGLINGLATTGQLCVQQDYPLPCTLVALYTEILPGDTNQVQWPKQEAKGK